MQVTKIFNKSEPRICRLTRQSRSDQYGFDFKTLKSEGRQVANNVRPRLPAYRAGLRDGDYILEVNGESLENMDHDAIVNKISSNPIQVDLLVVGDYKAYLANKKTTTKSATNNKQQTVRTANTRDKTKLKIENQKISKSEKEKTEKEKRKNNKGNIYEVTVISSKFNIRKEKIFLILLIIFIFFYHLF